MLQAACSPSPRPTPLTMLRTLWVWLCRGSGRGGMCTHSGTVTVPPSRSATITSSWVGAKGTTSQGPASPCSKAEAGHSPYQLLGLCLEGRVDPDDEGRGCAEDLQQLRRQDGHVGEAASDPTACMSPGRARRGAGAGAGGAGQTGTCI